MSAYYRTIYRLFEKGLRLNSEPRSGSCLYDARSKYAQRGHCRYTSRIICIEGHCQLAQIDPINDPSAPSHRSEHFASGCLHLSCASDLTDTHCSIRPAPHPFIAETAIEERVSTISYCVGLVLRHRASADTCVTVRSGDNVVGIGLWGRIPVRRGRSQNAFTITNQSAWA